MVARYTPEQKVQIIKWYYGGNSADRCTELFSVFFQDAPIPCKQTILNVVSTFENSHCVNSCSKCHREEGPVNEETEHRNERICSSLVLESTRSTRNVAEELGISNKTVARVWKQNGFKCFKYSKTHEIFPDDNFRRMEFCDTVMEKANQDPNFIKNIVFTDESSFSLSGKHNPSVLRYWSQENEFRSYEAHTQYPQKLNVWAGIFGDNLIGPFFIDGNLNAEKYLELLQIQVLPAIRNLPGVNLETIWFQQDGCPAHNAVRVKEFLRNSFPDRLMSGTGDIRWPPRSPDLSPNDFFLWGFLKSKVYAHNRANNLDELREKLLEATRAISVEMLGNVRRNFYDRLGYCLASQGGIFENRI